MGTKMNKAPVYFTVAEVRFNPVLSLEQYVAPIQERLRLAGYPDFERQTAPGFAIQAAEDAAPQLELTRRATYIFSDIDSVNAVVLGPQSLSLQTAEYEVFERFLDSLLKVLEMVHDIMRLSYTERIGIRYLDAVIPPEGGDLRKFLQPEMLGLVDKLEGKLAHSFSETMTSTEAGTMISRVVIQDGSLGFPPDIQVRGVLMPERFEGIAVRHAVLDTDGFHQERQPFDLPSIKARLIALHGQIDKSFRATVTKDALDYWR